MTHRSCAPCCEKLSITIVNWSSDLKNIFKILFIGSFIVAGFSVSFFILFHKNPQFDSLWKTFSKTIVMMTGEYEYGDLFTLISPNNETEHNPVDSQQEIYDNLPFVTGRIVLIIFVIIASIVFMNLMVGLAVRDVQALVNEVKVSIITGNKNNINERSWLRKTIAC